jgi:hypothetical protein
MASALRADPLDLSICLSICLSPRLTLAFFRSRLGLPYNT